MCAFLSNLRITHSLRMVMKIIYFLANMIKLLLCNQSSRIMPFSHSKFKGIAYGLRTVTFIVFTKVFPTRDFRISQLNGIMTTSVLHSCT